MQYGSSMNTWERFLPNLFILAGAGLIAIALAADLLGIGGLPGLGANQISLALSGFAILLAGVVLVLSVGQRYIGEWLLVGVGIIAVTVAADLPVVDSLPGFEIKQIMLASVVFGLLLSRVVWASPMRQQYINEWLNLFVRNKVQAAQFVGVIVQLGLLVLVMREFELENQAFYINILSLAFYGFLVHSLLPLRYRMPFFLLLSLAAIFGILGLGNGAWLVGVGLGLIALCHLPVPYSARVVILLMVGGVLVALRSEWFQAPWPSLIWPILASMFMFRLLIYMYDLKYSKEKPTVTSTLSYFFLLPNVAFPFFPVIDYSTFRRTYYDDDQYQIYQRGVKWIFRGVIHLLLYRFVNYYVMMAPQEVANVGDLVLYAIANFALYLRVSGQFHIVVGLLHLFGFNLPETHHLYFMASSFTDLWRRINIYWKDWMLKLFYYPIYFVIRSWGPLTSLLTATVIVFVLTWLFHAYQWFWLRGSFLLTGPDLLFWTLLTILVVAQTYQEATQGRKRSLGKRTWTFKQFASLTLKTAITFTIMTVLWSLWSAESISDWLSLWSIGVTSLTGIVGLLLAFVGLLIVFGVAIWFITIRGESAPKKEVTEATLFKSIAFNGAMILLVFLVGNPAIYTLFGGRTEALVADLTTARLSDREAKLLQRGYYEDLMGVSTFNADLWDVYSKKPTDWPLIQDTELARMTGDFRIMELLPLQSEVFHGGQFTTNRWAMRDQEYEQTPAPGTYRIALVGPSFVMGSGVTDEEVFEAVLENRLNKENSGAVYNRFEILNFGMAGYSALQELQVLEDKALSFEPDMIFFVAHQLEEEILVRNLANRFVLGSEIPYDYLQDLIQQAGANPDMTQAEAERLLKPYGEQMISWTYSRVVKLSQERGITPIWIFMPTLETALSEEEAARLSRLAEEAGFMVVSLANLYENQNVDSLVVAEWDLHPNAKGHKLIADRLYDLLREQEAELPPGIFSQIESP